MGPSDVPVKFRIDTGAHVSGLPLSVYQKELSHLSLQQVSMNLRGPDRKLLATVGVIEASVSKGNVKTKTHF